MTKLKNIAVALATLIIFTNITNAQEVKHSHAIHAEGPIRVKYLGDDGKYLLFQVTLQSQNPGKAVFVIHDKNEGVLYSSGLTTNLKVHTVKIEKGEIEFPRVLNFKLIEGRKAYSKIFSVNTHLVETTSVAETDLSKL